MFADDICYYKPMFSGEDHISVQSCDAHFKLGGIQASKNEHTKKDKDLGHL